MLHQISVNTTNLSSETIFHFYGTYFTKQNLSSETISHFHGTCNYFSIRHSIIIKYYQTSNVT